MPTYDVVVMQRFCCELVITEVHEEDSGDPEKVRLVIEAYRPGA